MATRDYPARFAQTFWTAFLARKQRDQRQREFDQQMAFQNRRLGLLNQQHLERMAFWDRQLQETQRYNYWKMNQPEEAKPDKLLNTYKATDGYLYNRFQKHTGEIYEERAKLPFYVAPKGGDGEKGGKYSQSTIKALARLKNPTPPRTSLGVLIEGASEGYLKQDYTQVKVGTLTPEARRWLNKEEKSGYLSPMEILDRKNQSDLTSKDKESLVDFVSDYRFYYENLITPPKFDFGKEEMPTF